MFAARCIIALSLTLSVAPAALAADITAPLVQATTPSASTALEQLFEDERAAYYRSRPMEAMNDGLAPDRVWLGTVAPEEQARRLSEDRAFLARLERMDRQALSEDERVSYDLFRFMVEQRVLLARYGEWRRPFNNDSGFYGELLFLPDMAKPRGVAGYEAYIALLNDVPRYVAEQTANMRQGLADGFTQPAEILGEVSPVIAAAVYERAEDSPLYAPFARFPESMPAAEQTRLKAAGVAALNGPVRTAYADFARFFETEYRPGATKALGASSLPDGAAYYRDLARYFTTLPDVTPEQIHQKGLEEIARIRAEMTTVMGQAGFTGSFAQFQTFLRTDPRFYPTTPEQLLREASWIAKEIDAKLPDYFGRLPRTPFTIKPVPTHLAPTYTAGRYNPGPVGAAGEYWVNTYALNTRPLYALPALTLHEAAPGHHTQGALSRELEKVPAFRLNFYPHAYGEGWGLYAEKLGVEMGVYHTPYEDFGRLSYEAWRAARLVVDTGIHSMGWSRQQARDYLTANTAMTAHEINTEVDRYISWPGQALAYKWGELKIWELRHRAEAALGDRFDVREFHDTVLRHGGVTLKVLEDQVDAYIAQRSTP
ncbi:DUF885 domain-containing protein [Brevundimonas faecalis]|uniref:DUF885 domain-containing protein n=1 Tax=Brevundimonas faecalis TaxID=947378 RepID=UPI00361C916A